MISLIISSTILALGLTSAVLILVYTIITGISPMPTMPQAGKTMLAAIPKNFDGNILELGSGWGTLAIAVARKFPYCHVTAYELSPLPWLISHCLRFLMRTSNLKIYRRNFTKISLTDADIILCYLFPEAMKTLKNKFDKELKPGTIIISNAFRVPSWSPEHIFILKGLILSEVYLYKKY